MDKVNPILLEVFKNRFASIAEEMGTVLQKTAFSSNIKERRDFSCAIFTKDGDMIAQAAHIPVHLGSMPMSVKSVIENLDMEEGDIAILNDPFKGGTHLPDITMVAPFFYEGELLFYVANRAHHADIGGATPGSMPISSSIFEEGLVIPPVKIVEKGKINWQVLNLIKNNVRTPEEREGDFNAQIAACNLGIKRLTELFSKYKKEQILDYSNHLLDYTEKIVRQFIKNLPDGTYTFEDFLEDDGLGTKDIKIKVSIDVKDDELIFDFSESDLQVKGSVNAVYAITLSAVFYVIVSLLEDDVPINTGALRAIKVKTKKGTVVDAKFPAGVAAGNVETSQRLVDVILGAFSSVLPDSVPAASQGTMNNLTVGGINPKTGNPFTYYETIGGGMGASAKGDGESAIQSHMTNTLNTPIEALEIEYPFMINQYRIRRNSGGNGLYKGGDGIVREYLFLTDVKITVISERRKLAPYGLFGGESGKPGENILIINGREEKFPSKFSVNLKKGDRLIIKTPGGGGFGKS